MQNVFQMISDGGFIMLPIALCSLIAVAIIIERGLSLRRHRVLDARVLRLVLEYRGEEHAQPGIVTCQRSRGAFARVIEEVIRVRHLDHAQAIESMHAVGRTQVSRLERGLTLLEIVAAVSPLLGLLGTVLGMVTVFNAITSEGLGNPQVLSEGISKALITTVAGLCVAIPALAFHSLFVKRVDDLAAEMQDRATSFIVKLQSEE
jgi:biopolymer transport protein ExbB